MSPTATGVRSSGRSSEDRKILVPVSSRLMTTARRNPSGSWIANDSTEMMRVTLTESQNAVEVSSLV